MLFNSADFVVFLLLALTGSFVVLHGRSWRTRKAFLVAASWLFYLLWHPPFLLLLLGSTGLDYFLGQRIAATTIPARRRALVLLSVAGNLSVLGYFKYGPFIAGNLGALLGWQGDPPLFDLVLPIGISFYTFESLSYVIDVYRGEPPCRRWLDFALFLSFFPHLVAGPIVRPRAFLPQLARAPAISGPVVERALARIAHGFFKKMVLADGLGRYVDTVWLVPDAFPSLNVALAIYAYAFQIYFDFSGYTDIALGLAQLWGFELPENFARPYAATDPRQFWQRWHISLSTWLRDYLYVSLGGNRGGRVRTYANLFVTMVLGGLWHGAAWTFVGWGAYHGAWLVLHRWWQTHRPVPSCPGWLRRLGTFHGVCLGWVLFRAPSPTAAAQLLSTLGPAWIPSAAIPAEVVQALQLPSPEPWVWSAEAARAIGWLLLAIALHAAPAATIVRDRFVALPPVVQAVGYAAIVMALLLESPLGARFIYFQF
jgi:alginate O-acetyltransferase complex protein AlgI